jgi:hypothetical protein
MKKVLVFAAVALFACPQSFLAFAVAPAFAQHGVSLGSAPSAPNGGGGGFAAPNAYGYAGSYTGGAGYSSNFGFNTMRPGNMPSVPFYGGGLYGAPYGYPAFGAPQPYGPAGQALYTMNYGGRNVRFWQSANGFYYPWVSSFTAPIVYIPTAGQSPQPTTPPISTICSDMLSYLELQKDKGNLSQDNYEHLRRRAVDIRNKERDLRISGSGSVDSQDEAFMRRDLEGLGAEMAKSISE